MASVYFNFGLPISIQMALDEALFEDLEKNDRDLFLRFYTASSYASTLGYFQGRRGDLSRFTSELKGPIVRRLTGGGLVRHGADLIFSLGAKTENFHFLKTARESYVWIHSVIQKALLKKGITTDLASCRSAKAGSCSENEKGICFKNPVPGDLIAGSEKIAGGAQKRKRGFFLHQGSINLENIILEPRSFSETLLGSFEEAFPCRLEIGELSYRIFKRAEELASGRYQPLELVPRVKNEQ